MSSTMGTMIQRQQAARAGRGGIYGGRGYQDPNLTPHYQRFLEHYGRGQPGPASEDPYYTRNPEYETRTPNYGPPVGGWTQQQKQQWAGMSPGARQAATAEHRARAEEEARFKGGRFQPGPWRGPGDMPEHLAGRRAAPIPESIFERPYDRRPQPMRPPPGYGPGETPGRGKLGTRRRQGVFGGAQMPAPTRTIGRTRYNRRR